jgi:hypothetical protein
VRGYGAGSAEQRSLGVPRVLRREPVTLGLLLRATNADGRQWAMLLQSPFASGTRPRALMRRHAGPADPASVSLNMHTCERSTAAESTGNASRREKLARCACSSNCRHFTGAMNFGTMQCRTMKSATQRARATMMMHAEMRTQCNARAMQRIGCKCELRNGERALNYVLHSLTR